LIHAQRKLARAVASILCIATLTVCALAQFETRGSSAVLRPQSSLATADFNHDGKLDVAAITTFTGQAAVLLGRGDGTFQPVVYYAIDNSGSESLRWVTAADFNGDGNMDLAVADYLGGYVAVLLGNGDGTFKPPIKVLLSGPFPEFVAVGDFNGDHIPDLVTVDAASPCPCISVLLGNGDGTFQSPINTKPSFGPSAIGIGDFNHDGKLDVAWVGENGGPGQLTILLGNGDGTFQTGSTYTVVADPLSVATADFNGDGKLDLAVAGEGGISVLLGNGDGTFQPAVNYPPGLLGVIQVADFNGDGKVDLVVVDGVCAFGSCSVGVLLGNGDGTFQPIVNYPAGKGIAFVDVGDFNGDHKPDLVVAEGNASLVGVLLNTGVVSFSPTTPLNFPQQLVGTTSAPQNVTLTNTGSTALSISSMSVSSPFQLSSGTTCATSVAPGGNCALSVVFQATAEGKKTGLLSILDSASIKPQVIELSGAGTVISLSPAQLTFPPQKVGTKSAPQTVTVTNTGSTAVSVSSVNIAGGSSRDYSQINTCGSQIGAGASCTVTVTFMPGEKGTRTSTLEINDNGGGSPQGVPLSGTGT
jgi:hypothetical protein